VEDATLAEAAPPERPIEGLAGTPSDSASELQAVAPPDAPVIRSDDGRFVAPSNGVVLAGEGGGTPSTVTAADGTPATPFHPFAEDHGAEEDHEARTHFRPERDPAITALDPARDVVSQGNERWQGGE
jgi:hypothetical protein